MRTSPPPIAILITAFLLAFMTSAFESGTGHAAAWADAGITVYSYGNARVQIVSPKGLRAGQDIGSGNVLKEIPGVRISREQVEGRPTGWTISLPAPAGGVYRLELLATANGGVVLDLDARDRSGRVSNSHFFKRVREGDGLRFVLDYDPEPGSKNSLEVCPPDVMISPTRHPMGGEG